MKFKFLLSFIFASAAFILPHDSARMATFRTSENVSPERTLSCSPEKLFSDGVLTLNMSVPHGGDLAVVDPDGKFFFVIYQSDAFENSTMRQPLMSSEEFASLRELKLPATLSATLMAKDSKGNQPVFTKTGWYELILSKNLETEIEVPVYKCRVYYSARR